VIDPRVLKTYLAVCRCVRFAGHRHATIREFRIDAVCKAPLDHVRGHRRLVLVVGRGVDAEPLAAHADEPYLRTAFPVQLPTSACCHDANPSRLMYGNSLGAHAPQTATCKTIITKSLALTARSNGVTCTVSEVAVRFLVSRV